LRTAFAIEESAAANLGPGLIACHCLFAIQQVESAVTAPEEQRACTTIGAAIEYAKHFLHQSGRQTLPARLAAEDPTDRGAA